MLGMLGMLGNATILYVIIKIKKKTIQLDVNKGSTVARWFALLKLLCLWVLSRCSAFLPQPNNMQLVWLG